MTVTDVAARGTNRRTITRTIGSASLMTVVQYAVSLVVAPVVLGQAGVSIFGVWATIASVLAVGALADAGLRLEIGRRVADALGEDDDDAMRRAVHHGTTLLAVVAGLVVVLGALAAPLIRAFVFPHGAPGLGAGELDLLLRLTFLLLGVSLLADGYFAVLRGIQRADVEYGARLIGLVVGTVVLVVGLFAGWSIWALFVGAAVQDVVAIGIQAVGVRRILPGLRFRVRAVPATAVRSMVALSGMALVSQLSDVVDSQWDKVMLSRYVGSAAVAGFQIGTTLTLQAKAVALLPVIPLLVGVAELRKRDRVRAERLLDVLGSATFALGAVMLATLVVFAAPFVRLWLDRPMPGAVISAQLFAVAVACNLLAAPLAYRALGESRHHLTAIASLANIVVNALLSYALTVTIGLRGPLYGSIVGNAVGTAVFFVMMRRALGTDWRAPSWRAPLIGVVAALGGLALGLDAVSTWPTLLLGVGAFAALVGIAAIAAERLPWRDVLARRIGAPA